MKKFFLSVALVIGLFGCSTTGDYQGGVNTAQVTNTTVVKLIGVGATSALITKKDANNLLKQVDTAQEGIEIANSLPAGTEATDKLTQSRAILSGILQYLARKGVK